MGRLFNNEEFYFSALSVLRFVLASIDRGSVSYVRSRANDVMNHIASSSSSSSSSFVLLATALISALLPSSGSLDQNHFNHIASLGDKCYKMKRSGWLQIIFYT